ncbi:MAG: c-type cytochrome [Bacteroidota bacterium]|nr:c-type cytochrome [Bacteroidota bacterium]MDX5404777.1 c-type cytochrome [Bacteroidota bacterium]MDX5428012.1 c-type cytochrome [Bacteroidota bacterium]MDX5448147.1 c-type cytochrome [Bacteroidota bacterium]MDX5505853.1 c-type cytochrome [Bacteroidota bacterium]
MRIGLKYASWAVLIPILSFFSCEKDTSNYSSLHPLVQAPEGFPHIPFPSDNEFTQEKWELGKRLFFDPILSIDSSKSCASCHAPELAFSDTVPFSPGVMGRPGKRNAPGLFNLAYQPYFLREGSVPTLEMQILVPIQEENEFAHNIVDIAKSLGNIPSYVLQSQQAFQRDPDPYVITRAIATFERTLVSGNAPYDRYIQGKGPLTASEKRGMDLFFSERTNCSSCHGGFTFTFHAFENNGLYEDYPDIGRERFTNDPSDRARFKTPSLRNVGITAPYMHDGSMTTLQEVILHYNSGGKSHPNKNPLIRPLKLDPGEIEDLVAFLHSLTDPTFISDPRFRKN